MKKILEGLYYLSILLVILPSLALSPLISSSHTLVGLIWGGLFVYVLFEIIKNKFDPFLHNDFFKFFLIFFFFQSITVITAKNLSSFLSLYEKILFSGIFITVSMYFIKDIKSVYKAIIAMFISSTINLLSQVFMFLNYQLFLYFGGIFFNKNYLDLISINIQRGRVYLESYDEMLIPLILYFWTINKNRKVLVWFTFLIPIISFLSLFRTKIIMLAFALLGFMVVFLREIKRYYLIPIGIGVIILSLYWFLSSLQFYTVFDRLTLQYSSDQNTITSRIERWGFALDMGVSSPAFGVGLGNYYDYLPSNKQQSISKFQLANQEYDIAAQDPHDIFFSTFAETGTFGLGTFVLLLLYFIKEDFEMLKNKKNGLGKAFVISFWTLFLYSLVNPSSSITYQSLFWLTRVAIYKLSIIEIP